MLATLLLLAQCAPVPQAPATPPRGASATSAELPLLRAHGLCFVELEWRGERLLALVDTGANASAVETEHARGLAIVSEGEVLGTTGSLRAESVLLEGLRFGALELPRLRATRRALGGLLAPAGRSVALILGSDAFVGRALTFDFGGGRLVLGPSAPAAEEHALREGEARLRLDEGIPALEAVLAGLALELRIDSGASLFESEDLYVNVPEHVWRALRERDPSLAPCATLEGSGASGEKVELSVVRVGGARIGPLERAQVFLIVQPERGYFARPDAKGFVGPSYLEKLGRVTLDYGAGRLRAGVYPDPRR